MKITIIGAGNSGLAMAAHLSLAGHEITLWNRTRKNIKKLLKTHTIYAHGAIKGAAKIRLVTDNLAAALDDPELILITTPASSHQDLAKQIAQLLQKEILIVLNPGRTFGALEFHHVYQEYNQTVQPILAETQTIIYTCRKTSEDSIDVISLKSDVLLSTFNPDENPAIIAQLPEVLQQYFIPAQSMIKTSLGNVGMILHCAPLLLNTGWTESPKVDYKYYYDGITPTISRLIEKIDEERVAVSKALGYEVETTQVWLERTYHIEGTDLYDAIHKNRSYLTIYAPKSLYHRYIFEDVPCGLVPLEAVGKSLGLAMKTTALIVDLASTLLETDFRASGRNLDLVLKNQPTNHLKDIFQRSERV